MIVKKSYNKYQQNAFERYARAKIVDLPGLIKERYQLEFSGSANNLDSEGNGLRLGLKVDHWVAVGTSTGDAVQSVRELEKHHFGKDIGTNEALNIIEDFKKSNGQDYAVPSTNLSSSQSSSDRKDFKLTGSSKTSDEVLSYVRGRGISLMTVNAAQEAGFLDKTAAGIRFIGRDQDGQARNAETRLIDPQKFGDKLTKFICAPGSDRSYPPVWKGADNEVHIVEGGFSALGLREIMNRAGKSPTIIACGGKDTTKWMNHDHIQNLLKNARKIVLHAENEKSIEIQEQADLATQKQCQCISLVTDASIVIKRPPVEFKDNADLNPHEKNKEKEIFSTKKR